MATDERIISVSEYLAELPPNEREQAQAQITQRVIAQAADDTIGKPPVRTLGDYLDSDIEIPPVLVEPGLLVRGGMNVLSARGGKGKTTLSLNKLVRWACGKPLFDGLPDILNPVQPLKSLVIENEGAPALFQMNIAKIVEHSGLPAEDLEAVRENILIWGEGGWSGFKIDDDANIELVNRAMSEWKPDILFVEPFRGLWRGKENDADEVADVLDRLTGVAVTHNACVMITHHERKATADVDPMDVLRGSTAFEGHAGTIERWVPTKANERRELTWSKNRYSDRELAPVIMEWNSERWGYDYVPEADADRELLRVLRAVQGQYMTLKDLSEDTNEAQSTLRTRLGRLMDEKLVTRRKADQAWEYRATADGGENDVTIESEGEGLPL